MDNIVEILFKILQEGISAVVDFSVIVMGGSEIENFPGIFCQSGQTLLFTMQKFQWQSCCVWHVADVGLTPPAFWEKEKKVVFLALKQ